MDRSKPLREQIMHHLKHLPIFDGIFDEESIISMADGCLICKFDQGEHIVHEGARGSSMFVINTGEVSVTQSCSTDGVVHWQGPSHIELARLGALDFFGEMSLFIGDCRSASVTALTNVECIEIPKQALFGILMLKPQIILNIAQLFHQRHSTSAAARMFPHQQTNTEELVGGIEKHFQMNKVIHLISTNFLFQGIVDDQELIRSTASKCQVMYFQEGQVIMKENDRSEDSMYIIVSGSVSVHESTVHCDTGIEMMGMEIARLGEGDAFGETSVILGDPRTASILALGHCQCIRIPKQEALMAILISDRNVGRKLAHLILLRRKHGKHEDVSDIASKIHNRFDTEGVMKLLQSMPIFEELAQQEELMRTMAALCIFEAFPPEAWVVTQEMPGSSLFIVRSGTLRVQIMHDGATRQLATLRQGDVFGEMSLLTGEPRSASVITNEDCELIAIPRDALRPILVAWPALTINMARVVTQRRQELGGAKEMSAEEILSQDINISQLSQNIKSHFDADTQLRLFQSLAIFSPIHDDTALMRLLISKCKLVDFQSGACMVRQHDKSDSSMYLIKSGAALVYTETKGGGIKHGPMGLAGKAHGGHSSRKWSMREQLPTVVDIASLKVGDFFGEMSILTGEPRSASVSALTFCECILIPKSALLPILISKPQLSYTIAEVITERRHALNWDQRKKAIGCLSERIDHFFKVDQVLRQHNQMIESELLSVSTCIMKGE